MRNTHTNIFAFIMGSIGIPAFLLTATVAHAVAENPFTAGIPFEQDLVITAYYSPLPDQCCYVKGSFEDDVILNGEGHHGADGTAVYPGMVAAPPRYPFGTRIVVPGIGTVTVHDRGGAIQEQQKSHRLDVWAGVGEEGLARALAFGVKRVRATVYPPGTTQPAEEIALDALPAPLQILQPYAIGGSVLARLRATFGSQSLSALLVQKFLVEMGYMNEKATGYFGQATRSALAALYRDLGLEESPDAVTERSAAFLEALRRQQGAKEPLPAIVDATSPRSHIAEVQRTMRFLDLYRGRTSGHYDDTLFRAIANFQKSAGLIADDSSPGAGRIGPKTRMLLASAWKRRMVSQKAEHILMVAEIERIAAKRMGITAFFGFGQKGDQVKVLQRLLASAGLLPADQVTGLFGPMTQKALVAFQMNAGIITSASDDGAGYVGPATLARVRTGMRDHLYRLVRAQGWDAL